MKRLLPISLLTGLLLAILVACIHQKTASSTPDTVVEVPARELPASRKHWLMHYMPWYETPEIRGRWGSHWTGHSKQHDPSQAKEGGLPDIWSHYHPLIGPYDSTDRWVLECQLQQMKLAGVDGVIVDWYGISAEADYPAIHQASQAMFDASRDAGMLFSVCFEDRTLKLMEERGRLAPADRGAHLRETLTWLDQHWFGSPHYVRIAGRPLFLNFGPVHVREAALWQDAMSSLPVRPLFFALHHLWRGVQADGGFTWVHHEPWKEESPEKVRQHLQGFYRYLSQNPEQVMVSAVANFHDVYDTPMRTLPHRDGETLRQTLRAGMEGPWAWMQLVTWNDYGEGTMLEPTHEFGYLFLEVLQEARRAELGADFPYTPADLRLPEQLLRLRRAKLHPAADLDRIAHLLNRGHPREAHALLQQLETL